VIDLLTVLREELGADRVLPQSGWSTRTRPGTFRPGAVMEHWTAAFSSAANPAPSTRICIEGLNRPDLGYYLPGPLYGFLVGHDGKLRLIHKGIGNHAGRGSLTALNLAMQGGIPHSYRPGADDAVVSAKTFGVALDYHPDQGRPPEAMIDCAVRTTAALHRWMGWTDPRVVRAYDHRHSTRRKRDNDVIADFRPAVAARLAATTPAIEEDVDMIRKGAGPSQYIRSFQFALNRFFTDTGGEPSVGWLVKDGVAGDQTFAAAWEAVLRLSTPEPGFTRTAQLDLRSNGITGPDVLEREGIDPVLVAAIVGAAAIR
jgi:hypothetical protein